MYRNSRLKHVKNIESILEEMGKTYVSPAYLAQIKGQCNLLLETKKKKCKNCEPGQNKTIRVKDLLSKNLECADCGRELESCGYEQDFKPSPQPETKKKCEHFVCECNGMKHWCTSNCPGNNHPKPSPQPETKKKKKCICKPDQAIFDINCPLFKDGRHDLRMDIPKPATETKKKCPCSCHEFGTVVHSGICQCGVWPSEKKSSPQPEIEKVSLSGYEKVETNLWILEEKVNQLVKRFNELTKQYELSK